MKIPDQPNAGRAAYISCFLHKGTLCKHLQPQIRHQMTKQHRLARNFMSDSIMAGGVIFFLTAPNCMGLSPILLTWSYSWYNGIYLLTDAKSTRIGAGHKTPKELFWLKAKQQLCCAGM